MDSHFVNVSINLHQEFITVKNIEQLLNKYDVPQDLDLLSIDLDGNDYHILMALVTFRPRYVLLADRITLVLRFMFASLGLHCILSVMISLS